MLQWFRIFTHISWYSSKTESVLLSFRHSPILGGRPFLWTPNPKTSAFSRYNSKTKTLLYTCTEYLEKDGELYLLQNGSGDWWIDIVALKQSSKVCLQIKTVNLSITTSSLSTNKNRYFKNMPHHLKKQRTWLCETIGTESYHSLILKRFKAWDPIFQLNQSRKTHADVKAHVDHASNTLDSIKERQMDPHFHALVLDPFLGAIAYVPDLGMDMVRQFLYVVLLFFSLSNVMSLKSQSCTRIPTGTIRRKVRWHRSENFLPDPIRVRRTVRVTWSSIKHFPFVT